MQQVLTAGATVNAIATTNDQAQILLAAVNALPVDLPDATLNLQMSGKVGQVTVNAPAKLTLYINGVHTQTGTTIDPHVPALVVNSGNVIVSNVTFTESGDAPTIVVQGGSLMLRNGIIQESTGFTDAAIFPSGVTPELMTPHFLDEACTELMRAAVEDLSNDELSELYQEFSRTREADGRCKGLVEIEL